VADESIRTAERVRFGCFPLCCVPTALERPNYSERRIDRAQGSIVLASQKAVSSTRARLAAARRIETGDPKELATNSETIVAAGLSPLDWVISRNSEI